MYCRLDDVDVLYSIKQWAFDPQDPVLADLSARFLHRAFFRVTFIPEPPSDAQVAVWHQQTADWLVAQKLATASNAAELVPFYFRSTQLYHKAYGRDADAIKVIDRNEVIKELSAVSDSSIIRAISTPEIKHYICHPKELDPIFI